MRRWVVVVAALLVLASCSTLVTIRANPENASIYINDEPKGKTPVVEKLPDGLFTHYIYRIEAAGYKPLYGQLQKEIKWGPFIGGFFLYLPWLWASGPKEIYYFELSKE